MIHPSNELRHRLAILGSTGSIGTQTLEIIRSNPEKFTVFALSARSNASLLAQQIEEFKPAIAVIHTIEGLSFLKEKCGHLPTEIMYGNEALISIVEDSGCTMIVNALVGFAGFLPTYHGLKCGKQVALANKESLVVGGKLINQCLEQFGGLLLPVDSEHSAIFQCIQGENKDEIEQLILTASGGPFRDLPLHELKQVTVQQALKHPNWEMGAKITIDSATMMNKGLEIIEAHWLFDLPVSRLKAVIHPQSIIHSMVEFKDGSTKAQLGPPDMMLPIQYALSYPKRWKSDFPRMNWSEIHSLEFRPVDLERYPCFRLALESIETGGLAPAILNAANEVAVDRFLKKEVPYIEISHIVERCLAHFDTQVSDISIDMLLEIDQQTRIYASRN